MDSCLAEGTGLLNHSKLGLLLYVKRMSGTG